MKTIKVPSKVICVDASPKPKMAIKSHTVPFVVKGQVYAVRGVDFSGALFLCGVEKDAIGLQADGVTWGPRGMHPIRFMAQTADMIELEVEDACPGVCLPPPLPRRINVVKQGESELKVRKA